MKYVGPRAVVTVRMAIAFVMLGVYFTILQGDCVKYRLGELGPMNL